MAVEQPSRCLECEGSSPSPSTALAPASEGIDRRGFLKTAAIAAGGLILGPSALHASPRASAAVRAFKAAKPSADNAVARLFKSLKDDQRKQICFSFEDKLRSRISANWQITPVKIESLTAEQQKIVGEIVKGVTSPEGYERMLKQMDEDDGGMDNYAIAIFGNPEEGKCHFELTGRHVTLRADADGADSTAFGGPIVYGHGAGDGQKGLPGNVYYYQTQEANKVFTALDGKQRESALLEKAPAEAAVKIQGAKGTFSGIKVGDLSSDQKGLVESVIKTILAPYREDDVNEAMSILKDAGGLDDLRMAFYKSDNLGMDAEWDIWRIEGPSFVTHFRGAPHVHAYINIAKKA